MLSSRVAARQQHWFVVMDSRDESTSYRPSKAIGPWNESQLTEALISGLITEKTLVYPCITTIDDDGSDDTMRMGPAKIIIPLSTDIDSTKTLKWECIDEIPGLLPRLRRKESGFKELDKWYDQRRSSASSSSSTSSSSTSRSRIGTPSKRRSIFRSKTSQKNRQFNDDTLIDKHYESEDEIHLDKESMYDSSSPSKSDDRIGSPIPFALTLDHISGRSSSSSGSISAPSSVLSYGSRRPSSPRPSQTLAVLAPPPDIAAAMKAGVIVTDADHFYYNDEEMEVQSSISSLSSLSMGRKSAVMSDESVIKGDEIKEEEEVVDRSNLSVSISVSVSVSPSPSIQRSKTQIVTTEMASPVGLTTPVSVIPSLSGAKSSSSSLSQHSLSPMVRISDGNCYTPMSEALTPALSPRSSGHCPSPIPNDFWVAS